MRYGPLGAGGAALGAAGVAFYGGQWPTAQLYGATVCRVGSAAKKLAITFDDGPNPAYTPELMRILERYDAHATFFLIGQWAEREPELIRELVAAGHAVGNHTHTHPTMPAKSAATIREELRRCRAAVEASGVGFTQLDGAAMMRPPYGRRRPGTLRTMRAEGYVPVTWSITGWDWLKRTTADKIAKRCAKAGDGDIILLHDGSDIGPAYDRSRSIAAAEATLRRYTEQGFKFVTVPQLVAAG